MLKKCATNSLPSILWVDNDQANPRKPAFIDDARRGAEDPALVLRDKTPLRASGEESLPVRTGLVPAGSVFQLHCFWDVFGGHQAKSHTHAPNLDSRNPNLRSASAFQASLPAAKPEPQSEPDQHRARRPFESLGYAWPTQPARERTRHQGKQGEPEDPFGRMDSG